MSDTLANAGIPINEWVDLYSLSSVSVGEQVSVQNVGSCDIYLAVQINQPPVDHDSYRIIKRGDIFIAESGSSGLWGFCNGSTGKVNITLMHPTVNQKTSFGELMVAQPTPVTQMAAHYGIPSKAFEFSVGLGSTSDADSLFIANSGAAANSLGTILTNRQMLYRPGQGSLCRLTAVFDTPKAGNQQFAGFITATDSYAFGYQDLDFGIIHTHHGVIEIQELTVTTPAGGSENASVTIDGTIYTVPLTAGTTAHNAFEIAGSLNAQVTGVDFSANGSTVTSVDVVAVINASFAFSSSTAVAAWVQIAAGAEPIEDFTPQAQWNRNTWPDLDPAKGNIYKIGFQYLGYGGIEFGRENPRTKEFVVTHVIEYANKNIRPSLSNPTLRAGWLSRNTTNATNVVVKGASVGLFNEGKIVVTEEPRGLTNTQAGVGSTQTNIFTVRNRIEFGGVKNRAETIPLLISAFTDGTKGAILEIRRNADISGTLEYSYLDKAQSTSEVATNNGSVTGGTLLMVVSVGTGALPLDLKALGIRLFPNDTITISMAVISGPVADMTATVTHVEDL